MGKKGKKRYRGHFCWCCRQIRPNEKFSGRGHSRHICRECQKLPKSEQEFRQAVRDIDRLLTDAGRVRKKKRAEFERFADHPNPRVRKHVEEIQCRKVPEREHPHEYEPEGAQDMLVLDDTDVGWCTWTNDVDYDDMPF